MHDLGVILNRVQYLQTNTTVHDLMNYDGISGTRKSGIR